MTDTIFALSSGAPPAAIAVVRVTGPEAGNVLRALCGRIPPPRRAVSVGLIDGEVAFTNIAYLYDLMDMQERRPRQQWWLELQQIADVVN